MHLRPVTESGLSSPVWRLGVSPSLLTPNSSHLPPVSALNVELGSMLPALSLHPLVRGNEESRASVCLCLSLPLHFAVRPQGTPPGPGFPTEMLNTD